MQNFNGKCGRHFVCGSILEVMDRGSAISYNGHLSGKVASTNIDRGFQAMRDCGVCTSMGQFWLYRYLSPDMRVSVQYMSGDRGVMCVKQQCFSERGLLMQLLGDSISNGQLVCACTLTGNVCPASQVLEAYKALVDSNVWSGFLLNGRIVKHQACQT